MNNYPFKIAGEKKIAPAAKNKKRIFVQFAGSN